MAKVRPLDEFWAAYDALPEDDLRKPEAAPLLPGARPAEVFDSYHKEFRVGWEKTLQDGYAFIEYYEVDERGPDQHLVVCGFMWI